MTVKCLFKLWIQDELKSFVAREHKRIDDTIATSESSASTSKSKGAATADIKKS